MVKDLRYFIDYLERKAPEEIIRIKREVNPIFEISAIVRKLQAENKYPIVFCEKVKGHKIPVVTNLSATRSKIAHSLETSQKELLKTWSEREQKPIPTKIVNNGPIKDVLMTGDDCDLRKLPIVTHSEKDSGPFITGGVLIAKDPDTGLPNVGIYRMMLKGPRKLGLFIDPITHLAHIQRKCEASNESLECAIMIGHHPACIQGSQIRATMQDELAVIGGILGEPLDIVKCETIGVEVPSYGEIVIEGKIPPHIREPEGPFGEFTFLYGPERNSNIVEVSAITHRMDAIYHDIYTPYAEHVNTGSVAVESYIYNRVKLSLPQVLNVHCPFSGTHFIAVIQIKKEYDGLGKMAGLAALSLPPTKIAIIVDEDIDPFNLNEVLWAIAHRTRPDRAIDFIKDVLVEGLEPMGVTGRGWPNMGGGINTKMIIDATKPIDVPFPERCDPPKEVWQKIDIKEYLKE